MNHNNESTYMHAKSPRGLSSHLGWIALLASLSLAGCGGGASTTPQAVPNTNVGGGNVDTYTGPAASTQDAQNFKVQVYDNIRGTDRCGGCHSPGGNAANYGFANRNNVNDAYSAALNSIDRNAPANSRIVQKIRNEMHHCWLGQSERSACAALLENWITAWVNPSNGGTTTVPLVPNTGGNVNVGATFPAQAPAAYSQLHGLLNQFCVRCHVPNVAQPIQPYFAVADMQASYDAVINNGKVNLTSPNQSRLYLRMVQDSHNCWDLADDNIPGPNCNTGTPSSGSRMLDAINALVAAIPQPNQQQLQSMVISRAVNLQRDGIAANGGNRYDANVIAMYEFKTGTGSTVIDSSGAGNSQVNLNLEGTAGTDYVWLNNWGIRFLTNNGRARATTATKLQTLIMATNEYSVEAWVVPDNIAQANSSIIAFSIGSTTRNFTLGQNNARYQFFNRSNATGVTALGAPVLDSRADTLSAALQHVVVTYNNSTDRRRIYVDGQLVSDADSTPQGTLGGWGNLTFMMGNEPGNNRPWRGTIRMAAVHNRALTANEVRQNFDAGVGQKYFLLFNISTDGSGNAIPGVPAQSYVKFEVAQFDNFGYLFKEPTYVNLGGMDPTGLRIRAIRIGVNGTEAPVGQSFGRVDATVGTGYTAVNGQQLSRLGAIIPLDRGAAQDMFFLTFELVGNAVATKNYNPATPTTPVATQPGTVSDVMIRTFEEINASLSELTGVPRTTASIGGNTGTYTSVFQQLPPVESINGFLASQQMAVTQLAIQYCSVLADNATMRTAYFSGVNFAGMSLANNANRDLIINPLLTRVLNEQTGNNLLSQPDPAVIRAELRSLIGGLVAADAAACPGSNCNGPRTISIVKATCAAALAGAPMLVQ